MFLIIQSKQKPPAGRSASGVVTGVLKGDTRKEQIQSERQEAKRNRRKVMKGADVSLTNTGLSTRTALQLDWPNP